jgi:hypothetical protein
MMQPVVLLCLVTLAILATVPEALADYYKYTDSRGVISITNKLASVPAKYRSTMKVVREAPPTKKDAGAGNQLSQPEAVQEEPAASMQESVEAPAAAPAGKFAELSARFAWFKPLVYLGVIVLLFVAITKLTTVIPSPLLAKLIYLGFFMGVFVFIYKAYVEHVADTSRNIKEKAVSIIKNSTVKPELLPDGEAAPLQQR